MIESEALKSEKNIKDLTSKRSSIKGRITKFKNYLEPLCTLESVSSFELMKLKSKLSKFESLFEEFDGVQSDIEVINVATQDVELSVREVMEQDFHHYMALAQQLVETNSSSKTVDHENFGCSRRASSSHCHHNEDCEPLGFKLPTIKIHTFDGTYFRWLEFRDTFTALVHENAKIRDIHKFYYLNSYLEGEAARVICNLEVTEKNYLEAWRILCERYDNKRQLINNHLKSLFSLESVRETDKSLRFIIDHVTKNLRALSTLGLPTDKWDMLIIYIVAEKLDSKTYFKWEENKNTLNEIPTLEDFFNFLRNRADVLETVNRSKQTPKQSHVMPTDNTSRHKTHTKAMVVASKESSPSSLRECSFCKGQHRLYECTAFQAKSVEDRMSFVSSLKLCHNCLRSGHNPRRCRLPGGCKICKQRHNSLLHEYLYKNEDAAPSSEAVAMPALSSSEVLLCTAEVNLTNPLTGNSTKVRALLDSASQSSFITERVKQALQLTPQPSNTNVVGIGDSPLNVIPARCSVRVQSNCSPFSTTMSCLVLPTISGKLPKAYINIAHLNLSGFQLADPSFNKPSTVDMLIGADLFWDLIESKQHSLGDNNPVLRSSKLGWLVAGPIFPVYPDSNKVHCNFSKNDDLPNLNDDLAKFWQLETVPDKATLSEEEKLCEQHFLANTTRCSDGRFCVKLPLRDDRDCLGDSYRLAKIRFLNLEKRFKRQPLLKELYFDFMQEYADLGHLSEYEMRDSSEVQYYLPHHPVLRENSESTKLRVVFDASARTTSGFSMNHLQMVGPTIQDSLFNILTRFRTHKYVLSGDIEKMYRQILVHDEDRSLQLVLWRDDESLPLRTLRLNTVTYGFSSASFLSTRCLWQLGEESDDSKVKDVIQKDFYVDDMLTGAQTEVELRYIQRSVAEALMKGGFHLRKYRSNLPLELDCSDDNKDSLVISNATSTLGIGWFPTSDEIYFPIEPLSADDVITKRSILSSTFKIFDPLGLLSLCTIKPKMLLQELWAEVRLGWDDPVPEKIRSDWLKFTEGLENISQLRIDRNVLIDDPINVEMHCFCDSSQKAYGACIYLKSTNEQGDSKVSLLCAKSRVAPINPTTIPRLELCAALLGAQLASVVTKALRFNIDRHVYWSDSKVVLSWLNTTKAMKTFVANRVGTIKELSDPSAWRYVPTSLNPADLVSRGIDPQQLPDSAVWWEGPNFLLHGESMWPSSAEASEVVDLPEIKALPALVGEPPFDLSRISRLTIAQRAYARIVRWFHNAKQENKNSKITGPLQASELEKSMTILIKMSQKYSFQNELTLLSQNKPLKPKSNIASLNVFIDSEGVLRAGGRIAASSYDFDKKHPMLLHANSKFTVLLFQQEHSRLMHAGPQLLLASIRDRFWPVGGRNLARRTARNCLVCSRFRGRPMSNIMGNLPTERVVPNFPFYNVGTDFGGPYYITDRKGRGCKITKCYLCIFICFSYKCMHLEAVSELSKDAFLLTLKRFIARRGLPKRIFCDNGTNFVAAAREIKDFFNDKENVNSILDFTAQQGIEFKFSPAYAPHFGGYHEAGIKSAKFHLHRIMGNAHFTFEELSSLFSQIEAILNSRPLCPLSPSPDDLQPLTPGHLLIGRPLTALPAPCLMDLKTNRLDRYQRLEQVRQHFWRRWSNEYVGELQQRTKWRARSKDLKVDDLVLLKDDSAPPLCWRLGRVNKLFPGPDGVPRVADVSTARGMVRRALNRICLLPSSSDDNS